MPDEGSGDEAAQAFEELRAEVTLMRRAVERLTAERTELPEVPNYSETLGAIAGAITSILEHMSRMAKSPALSLAPADIGRQIASAGNEARASDQRALAAARQSFEDMTSRLNGYLRSAHDADVQSFRQIAVGGGALVAGMLIWAVFAGIVARHVPANWQWPQRMATRTLDMPMWAAGQDLMATADPTRWDAIAVGDTVIAANRDALAACQRAAARAKKPVHCTIEVKAAGA